MKENKRPLDLKEEIYYFLWTGANVNEVKRSLRKVGFQKYYRNHLRKIEPRYLKSVDARYPYGVELITAQTRFSDGKTADKYPTYPLRKMGCRTILDICGGPIDYQNRKPFYELVSALLMDGFSVVIYVISRSGAPYENGFVKFEPNLNRS